MADLSKNLFGKFLDLCYREEPENLSCDGELSRTQVSKRLAQINREWKALEVQAGRKVTSNEIWDVEIRRMREETNKSLRAKGIIK